MWCVSTSLANVNMDILKQQGLSCYCTVCVIAAPNKEHTCLIWAQGFSHAQWSQGPHQSLDQKHIRARAARDKRRKTSSHLLLFKTVRLVMRRVGGRGVVGRGCCCCCQVGARYPPSTSSPVLPAYLSHLAISPGEPLIVPPRAVRKVWRRRRKPDIKMQKGSQMNMKEEWIEFARSHKNGSLLNAWRISKVLPLRCEWRLHILYCFSHFTLEWNNPAFSKPVFISIHLFLLCTILPTINSSLNCRRSECQQEPQWARGQ